MNPHAFVADVDDATCTICGGFPNEPEHMRYLQARIAMLEGALKKFMPTNEGEWGRYLAWMVGGAPTRDEGIAAARKIQHWRVEAEAALAPASPAPRQREREK